MSSSVTERGGVLWHVLAESGTAGVTRNNAEVKSCLFSSPDLSRD